MSAISRPPTAPLVWGTHDNPPSNDGCVEGLDRRLSSEVVLTNPFAEACQQLDGLQDLTFAIDPIAVEAIEPIGTYPEVVLEAPPEAQARPDPADSLIEKLEASFQEDMDETVPSLLPQDQPSHRTDVDPVMVHPSPTPLPLQFASAPQPELPSPLSEDFYLMSTKAPTTAHIPAPSAPPVYAASSPLRSYQR
jgi:hypothetical protein